jgi:tRNA A-37 threonylcarbamoyl transferase component Bud32
VQSKDGAVTTQFSLPSFTTRRSFSRVAYCHTALPADLVEILWTAPESLLDRGEVLRCKGARRTVRMEWNDQPFVLKRYVEPTWRHAAKQLISQSRAAATWKFTHRLADAGIATPRPVARIENRFGLLRLDSYLMYPYVEGHTLRSYFADEAKQTVSMSERIRQQVHELWARLQELKVSLGDAHSGNFVVCPEGQVWLIDLDKSRFHRAAKTAAARQRHAWKKLVKSAPVD